MNEHSLFYSNHNDRSVHQCSLENEQPSGVFRLTDNALWSESRKTMFLNNKFQHQRIHLWQH